MDSKSYRRTLILNQGYEPLMVVNWKRAFILVFLEKAETVVSYDKFFKSSSSDFQIPAVIRLHTRVRAKRRGTGFSRRALYERDAYACLYCGEKGTRDDLTMDHVHPKSRGGRKTWQNIATSCKPCNTQKGDKTPEEAGMPLLKKPRKPAFTYDTATPKEWKDFLFV